MTRGYSFVSMNKLFLSSLAFGFVTGLRHALDPDHVVAVSTIVSESRSTKRSSLVGTFWGLGHTLSLLIAGVAVIALKLTISERMSLWMEFAVALMLVFLGARAMRTVFRGWRLHRHRHQHDATTHSHLHIHPPNCEDVHLHQHLFRIGARPFLVGMIHGMAGSGALMILVLATIPSAIAGLIYIATFGLGSVGGMLLMSSLISLPIVMTAKRSRMFGSGLQLIAGMASLSFGLFLVWHYGVREGLVF
jgi:ABC-type nickel/cobalt efflux system permease component RcnA